MKKWGVRLKPICALLAALLLLAAPLHGALAAREALVKAASATMRQSANGSGKALFVLKKGARVTVTAVKGNVARVTYKGKTGYLLTSYLTLAAQAQPKAAAKAEPKTQAVLRETIVYKAASASSQKLTRLRAGEKVQVLAAKGNWVKVARDGQTGFVPKTAFTAPAAKAPATLKPTAAPKPTPKPTATPAPKPAATPADEGGTAMTTTRNARVYVRASQSAASKKVPAGTQVTMLSEKGGWYKVRRGGITGFMLRKAFAEVAPSPTEAPSQSAFKPLKTGSSGAAVLKLQKRLEVLGYLDIVPSGKYASTTAMAVRLFQAENGLKKTGAADADTQSALYAEGAKSSGILTASLKAGGNGENVKRLQLRLRSKGYYAGKINGKYTDATQAAVKAYQAAAGLKQDGAAGPATLRSLFSPKAPKAGTNAGNAEATPAPSATPKPTAAPAPSATPKPSSTPKPSNSSSSRADKVIAAAKAKLGRPYVLGAVGPSSYDCSGLTRYAYGKVGISLPHSAYQVGYRSGSKVSRDDLKRGDIVCFNTVSDGDLVDHVGIYLGGGSFIHASSGQGRVVISSLTGYYARAFSWGRSVL